MQLNQEKDAKLMYQKRAEAFNEDEFVSQIQSLEEKIREFRKKDLETEERLRLMTEELEGKDEEIDNLLSNLDNSNLLEEIVKLGNEKEALQGKLGTSNFDRLDKLLQSHISLGEATLGNDNSEFEIAAQINDLNQKYKLEIAKLTQELELSNGERSLLKQKYQVDFEKFKDFEDMIKNLEFERKALQDETFDLKAEIDSLRDLNSRITRDQSNLKNESSDLWEQTNKFQNTIIDLEKKLKKALVGKSEDESEILRLRVKLEDVQESLSNEESKLAIAEKRLEELQNGLSSTTREQSEAVKRIEAKYMEEVQSLTETIDSMKQQMEDLRNLSHYKQSPSHVDFGPLSAGLFETPKQDQNDSPSTNIIPRKTHIDFHSLEIPEEHEPSKGELSEGEVEDFRDLPSFNFNEKKESTGVSRGNTMYRRDTQDRRRTSNLSNQNSRKNSVISSFAFRAGKSDEKLLAEINELKIRQREIQDSGLKKLQEHIVRPN